MVRRLNIIPTRQTRPAVALGDTDNNNEVGTRLTDQTSHSNSYNYWTWLGPLVFFGLLTLIFTYPLAFHFTSQVPGKESKDRLQNLWNLWWLHKSFGNAHNPYLTEALFYPYFQPPLAKLPLYFHDLQAFNGLITWPLQWLGDLDQIASYNLIVILATFLSGVGTYALARRIGTSAIGAGLAGAIFAFAPVRMSAINESITNIQSTEFLPFYAFFLHSVWQKKDRVSSTQALGLTLKGSPWSKRMVLGAIVSLTLCIYTDWYNTIYLLFYSLFYLLWMLFKSARNHKFFSEGINHHLKLITGVGGVSFLMVTPLLIPSILNLNNSTFRIIPGYDLELRSSASLWSLVSSGEGNSFTRSGANNLSWVGLGFLTLAILALLRYGRRLGWYQSGLYYLSLSGSAVVMALGPELNLTQSLNTHLPLPYALFRLLPVVSVTRAPYRFLIVAMLGVAVLSALSFDWLTQGLGQWWQRVRPRLKKSAAKGRLNSTTRLRIGRTCFATLLIGLFSFQVWEPLALFQAQPNPFMASLKNQPGEFYLLELPITRHYNQDQLRMFNQIAHQRPIMGGYLSRPVVDPYFGPDSVFSPLANLTLRQKRIPLDVITQATNEEDLDAVVALYNFRYIVVYRDDYGDKSQLSGLLGLLNAHYGPQQQVYEDAQLTVFQVPPAYLRADPTKITLALGSGWYSLEHASHEIWRWTNQSAKVYLTSKVAQHARLQVKMHAFGSERLMSVQLNSQEVAQTSISVQEMKTYSFDLDLVVGRNEVTLANILSPNSPDHQPSLPEIGLPGNDSRQLTFMVASIQASSIL